MLVENTMRVPVSRFLGIMTNKFIENRDRIQRMCNIMMLNNGHIIEQNLHLMGLQDSIYVISKRFSLY